MGRYVVEDQSIPKSKYMITLKQTLSEFDIQLSQPIVTIVLDRFVLMRTPSDKSETKVLYSLFYSEETELEWQIQQPIICKCDIFQCNYTRTEQLPTSSFTWLFPLYQRSSRAKPEIQESPG